MGLLALLPPASDEPATDIDLDVMFLGSHGDHQMVEVTATLENKSFVRHHYKKFRMNLRYLRPGDQLADGGANLNYQLLFPHTIDDRLPAGHHRYFPRAKYINPRQRFHHRYVTFVPGDATFIRVHCKFEFKPTGNGALRLLRRRERSDGADDGDQARLDLVYIDSQRVFRVPHAEPSMQAARGSREPSTASTESPSRQEGFDR